MSTNSEPIENHQIAFGKQTPTRSRVWQILLCLLLVLASARFAVRGIANAPFNDYSDFMTLFAAARAWVSGANTYDFRSLTHAAVTGGLSHVRPEAPSVYPPMLFPLIAPICALPWRIAIASWAVVNLFAAISCIDLARRICRWQLASPRTIALAALFLLLDPTSIAESSGQTSLVACVGILSCILLCDSRPILAGLCLAAAICIKPQLALPAAFVIFLTGRYRPIAAMVLGGAAVTAVALLRLGQPGPWIASWIQNLHLASRPGGVNDPSGANPFVYQLLNLQYPLHTFLNSDRLIALIVIAIIACLAIPLASVRRRRQCSPGDLLLLAGLAEVIGLLAIYHRNYDGVVLILPIAWYLSPGVSKKQLATFLVLIFFLTIPNGAGIQRLKDSTRIPIALREAFIWRSVVVPYQNWALFGIGVLAAVTLTIRRRESLEGVSVTERANVPSL